MKSDQTGTFTVGTRLLGAVPPAVQADVHLTHSLEPGRGAFQDAGAALGARNAINAAMEATGSQLIAVNATGCMEVCSTPYQETSWRIPWIHSLSGNAAAVASGVAAAQRALGRAGVRVIAQGDDVATGIGFGCLSGMFDRNDDVLYICYDTSAYMHAGVQRSDSTPPAAPAAATPQAGPLPRNVSSFGKNVPRIAMAQRIPYVATASVSNLRDLKRKVRRAMGIRGARYVHILVPSPPERSSTGKDTIKIARLIVESGVFPLFEAHDGKVTASTPIRRKVP